MTYTPAMSSVETHAANQVALGPYTTAKLTFATGQTIAANTPVAIKAADKQAYPHNPAASDGTQTAIAITVHAVNTTGGAAVQPVYDGGHFNAEAINWDASLNTLDKQKAAFVGKGFNIDKPY